MFDFLRRKRKVYKINFHDPDEMIDFIQYCIKNLDHQDLENMNNDLEKLEIPDEYLEAWK